jgi:protein TonB
LSNDLLAPDARLARTPAGSAELNRPTDLLSVPERKLLLLVQRGIAYRTLMDSGLSSDWEHRDRDLARLFELGLVALIDTEGNTVTMPFAVARLPSGPASMVDPAPEAETNWSAPPSTAASPAGSSAGGRTIAVIAGAGVLLLAGLAWWVLSGDTETPVSIPPVTGATPGPAAPPATAETNAGRPDAGPAPLSAPTISAGSRQDTTATAGAGENTPESKAADVPATTATAGKPASRAPITGASPATSAPVAPGRAPPGSVAPAEPATAASTARVAPPVASSAQQPATASAAPPAPPSAAGAPVNASAPPAAVSSGTPAAGAAPKILTRVNPEFPVEAARSGITAGTVRARMRVGSDGAVTGVDILESNPLHVFDRAVIRALSQWKFEPTGQPRTVDHEIEFR